MTESDGDLLARLGTDAVKWAEEFFALGQCITTTTTRWTIKSLIGWFARRHRGRTLSRYVEA